MDEVLHPGEVGVAPLREAYLPQLVRSEPELGLEAEVGGKSFSVGFWALHPPDIVEDFG